MAKEHHCACGCHASEAATSLSARPGWKNYLPAVSSFVLLVVGIGLDGWAADPFFHGYIRLGWYLIAYLPVGWPVWKAGWEALRQKELFNEFTLMGIATLGAFYIGEYPEGVAVMLFYAIGELFQEHAVNRAKRSIHALLDIRPESATVIREEGVVVCSPEAVEVGETVEVKAGERVPLDGTLQNDFASFNTSALTGESTPRDTRAGGEVLAGMIATDRVVRLTVTHPFAQSAFARILTLVQEAAGRKAPAEKFIRKFARVYTPIVVGLALLITLLPWGYAYIRPELGYDFNTWLYRGLIFLVISCPCALVISIPLSYFGGIGAASRQGILFKGGNYLDLITRVDTVVMDKTGTLTEGTFRVREVVPEGGLTPGELLQTVATVEAQSTHPIAKAIVASCTVSAAPPSRVREIAGEGVEALLGSRKVVVGNSALLERSGIAFPLGIRDIPDTTVLCAIDGVYAGYLLLADTPKADAREAITLLQEAGIKRIAMLSGDKQAIISALAQQLGIDEAYGDLLPEGKVKFIEQLKTDPSRTIAFVGDGINDAPVLALSDVGIAMGGLGSDVAIETADVVIQTDQPGKIATAIRIGHATHRIVIQNIILALAIKILVMGLGIAGIATLWEAVFADVGVALLAILNATRVTRES